MRIMCEDNSSSKWSISCTSRLETTTNHGKHTNNNSKDKGKDNNTINSKAEVLEQRHHNKPAMQLPSETSPRRRETQR